MPTAANAVITLTRFTQRTNMINFLSSLNYTVIGFSAFAIRLAILGASLSDALAMFAFAGLYGFQSWLKQKQIRKYNEDFEAAVKVEFQKAATEITALKSTMGAINLGSTYNQGLRKAIPNVRE